MGQLDGTTRRQSRNSPSSSLHTSVAFPTWNRMCFVPRVKAASSSTSVRIFSTSLSPAAGTTKFISRPVPSSGWKVRLASRKPSTATAVIEVSVTSNFTPV